MAEKDKIKIRDTRKYDAITGKLVSDKSRMHADVDSSYVDHVVRKAKKYNINPYTALAINLQETNFKNKDNPFSIFNMVKNIDDLKAIDEDPIDYSMKQMSDKFALAKRLGKKTEEEEIQGWNGWGKLKAGTEGITNKAYGLDISKEPLDMNKNPVYGKRIVNLRDSVIKTNPEIVKIVDKYNGGGKIKNTPMKNKDLSRYRVIDLYDGSQYDLGGWLGENKNALTGAGSGALSGAASGMAFGPIGAVAGGLIGGVTGLLGGSNADKIEEQQEVENERRKMDTMLAMPQTVGKENMTPNVMSFKRGGGLSSISAAKAKEMLSNPPHGKKLSKKQKKAFQAISHGWKPSYENGGEMMNQDLIEIEGPSHEEGGIQFTPDAELEGGETIYDNVVNSDSIKITKEIAEMYGLPKQSINKTVAEYSKIVNNKYKGRDVDPFAMKSKEIELNNLAQISMQLAKTVGNNKGEYQNGSDEPLTGWRKRVHDRAQTVNRRPRQSVWDEIADPFKLAFGKGYQENYNNPIPLGTVNISANPNSGIPIVPIRNESINNQKSVISGTKGIRSNIATPDVFEFSQKPGYFPQESVYNADYWDARSGNTPISKANTSNLFKSNRLSSSLAGAPASASQSDVTAQLKETGLNKLGNSEKLTKALGLAPLAVGAFQTIRSALDKPEQVNLGRVHYDPMHPEFIDPAYQLRNVEDVYATGNEQMSQASRKDFLRRRIQSATEEAKAKSSVLGQVQAANTQMLNQTRQQNQQNRMQTNQINAELGLQEENINAANRGAWQTNRDYQLNNLASMAGEYARDRRLETADERFKTRSLGMFREMGKGLGIGYTDEGVPYRTEIGGTGINNETNNRLSGINFNANRDYLNDYNNRVRLEQASYYQNLRNPLNGRNWLTSGRTRDRLTGSF